MIEYRNDNTVMHRLPPTLKLLIFLLFVLAAFFSRDTLVLAALLFTQALLFFISRLPLRETFSFSKFFFALSIIMLGFHWFFGEPSLGVAIVLRLWILALAIPILLFTTRMAALARALSTFLPKQLAFVVVLAIRFIPVVLREFEQVKAAQSARANKSLIPVFSPLFFKAFWRAEHLALAAEARAFEAAF